MISLPGASSVPACLPPRVACRYSAAVASVPGDPAPPGMQRFWILHAAYTSLEMLKLVVGLVVTWWIASSR